MKTKMPFVAIAIALIACGLIVGTWIVVNNANRPKPALVARYPIEESLAKLKAIGKSLLAYRAAQGVKPLKEWRLPSDAGLPNEPYILIEPGHPWTLPGGMQSLRINRPWQDHMGDDCSNFAWTTPIAKVPSLTMPDNRDWPAILAAKGERLIFCVDDLIEPFDIPPKSGPHKVLVLRINGEVELIEFVMSSAHDILMK